jgi:hypothetical protein
MAGFKLTKSPKSETVSEASPETIAAFAAGADERRAATGVAVPPWQSFEVGKPTEIFNLRLNKQEKAQAEFVLAESKSKSMQALFMSILMPEIERLAVELWKKQNNEK